TSALAGWCLKGDARRLLRERLVGAHDLRSLGGLHFDPAAIHLPAGRVDLIQDVAEIEIDHSEGVLLGFPNRPSFGLGLHPFPSVLSCCKSKTGATGPRKSAASSSRYRIFRKSLVVKDVQRWTRASLAGESSLRGASACEK